MLTEFEYLPNIGLSHGLCTNRSFFDSVKRVAKQVQGALPVIGLVSRLTSSEGGFDELVGSRGLYIRSVLLAYIHGWQ
jgi:hypothetical protein